jgi:nucleoside-diphosphate-sugar epimerase
VRDEGRGGRGTGVVGRHVVDALWERGDDVTVLARSVGVDLVSGAGLHAALAGCDAVVDVATARTVSRRAAIGYFEAATGNLVAAAARAGVGHLLALSIVGADTVDLPSPPPSAETSRCSSPCSTRTPSSPATAGGRSAPRVAPCSARTRSPACC